MTTRLVLVRHGATVWHAENRYAGSTDVALDASGLAQAERLAAWAPGAGLAAIWCSPLSRARTTAEPAARATGLELQIDARLRELDFGQIEGKTIAEAEELFPEEIRRFQADPVTYPMPGGEDPHAAAKRALAALRDIAAAHPGARVLVVAHNTLIRLTLCSLLGIPLPTYRTVFPAVRNGALTELAIDGQRFSLLQYNTPLPPL
ncbi:MAG: histidine phosphatase family protein [Gluconacetobacter diazotrophicus]|nr:histidine phosphatase family protein [Gluconacetobacter diazotrophicus]